MNDRELTKPFEPSAAAGSPPAFAEPADRDVAELLSGVLDVKVSTAQRLLARLGALKALCAASEPESL